MTTSPLNLFLPSLLLAALVGAGCGDDQAPPCPGTTCLPVVDAAAMDSRSRQQPTTDDAAEGADDAGAADAGRAQPPPPPPPFEVSFLDPQVSPCDDFYSFACGGWIKKNALGPGELGRSTYSSWSAAVWEVIRAAIDQAVLERHSGISAESTTIGNFYQSCMDAEHQTASRQLLRPFIDMIGAANSLDDLATVTAALRRRGIPGFFLLYAGVDPGDSSKYLLTVDQGARQLPTRHHYFDAGLAPARAAYLQHIQRLATLMAVPMDPAAVVRVETALAEGELTPAEKTDPLLTYNKMPLAEAVALAPAFPWQAHLQALGVPAVAQVNVLSKGALGALQKLLTTASLDDLKHYLRWQVLDDKASLLDREIQTEEFAFHGKVIDGLETASSRRSTCLTLTRNRFPFHLSKAYVNRHFPEGTRQEANALVKSVKAAFARRLERNDWLDPATRSEALAKLGAMGEKVGHPVPLPTITTAPPLRTLAEDGLLDSFGGIVNALQPTATVNRGAWLSSAAPYVINAFYSRNRNDINLPAAVLHVPHFGLGRSPAANYGAIGRTIGHEITHGFDSAGRFYDGTGSLRSWWSPAVDAEFRKRAQCVGDRWGQYEALPGRFVDPVLTMTENIADLDGTKLALEAYLAAKLEVAPYMGYSDRQQFFVANAQARCSVYADSYRAELLRSDSHAPDRARVNLTLSEMPEFAEAWSCPAGAKMRVAPACPIW